MMFRCKGLSSEMENSRYHALLKRFSKVWKNRDSMQIITSSTPDLSA